MEQKEVLILYQWRLSLLNLSTVRQKLSRSLWGEQFTYMDVFFVLRKVGCVQSL